MITFHRNIGDDIFNQLLATHRDEGVGSSTSGIKLDLAETKDGFEATFELPGVKKEDVKLSFKDHVLTVSGETVEEKEGDDEEKKYHWKERTYGSVERSIKFPKSVDTTKAKAKYDHGILKVVVPKAKEQTNYIKID